MRQISGRNLPVAGRRADRTREPQMARNVSFDLFTGQPYKKSKKTKSPGRADGGSGGTQGSRRLRPAVFFSVAIRCGGVSVSLHLF